jgi:hypothetical protein
MSSCLAVPISGTSKLDRHLVCDRSGLAREDEAGAGEDDGRGRSGDHHGESERDGKASAKVGVGILAWDVPHDTKVVGEFDIYKKARAPPVGVPLLLGWVYLTST